MNTVFIFRSNLLKNGRKRFILLHKVKINRDGLQFGGKKIKYFEYSKRSLEYKNTPLQMFKLSLTKCLVWMKDIKYTSKYNQLVINTGIYKKKCFSELKYLIIFECLN